MLDFEDVANATLMKPSLARALVERFISEDEDGWFYVVRHTTRDAAKRVIAVIDQDCHFLGYL